MYREFSSIGKDNALLYAGVHVRTSNTPFIHLKRQGRSQEFKVRGTEYREHNLIKIIIV